MTTRNRKCAPIPLPATRQSNRRPDPLKLRDYKKVTTSQPLVAYRVWDAPTRWFHRINALAVLGLIVVGTVLLFDDSLGMSGAGKVTANTKTR